MGHPLQVALVDEDAVGEGDLLHCARPEESTLLYSPSYNSSDNSPFK
jgi:hypothetical protein